MQTQHLADLEQGYYTMFWVFEVMKQKVEAQPDVITSVIATWRIFLSSS